MILASNLHRAPKHHHIGERIRMTDAPKYGVAALRKIFWPAISQTRNATGQIEAVLIVCGAALQDEPLEDKPTG